jgi:hypothetical protein
VQHHLIGLLLLHVLMGYTFSLPTASSSTSFPIQLKFRA